MPAQHQDMWWRPMSDIPVTEPRWVRMVEIRPTNLKARKIVHHAIAYHVLSPDNTGEVNTGIGSFGNAAADDLVNRRPQLMEWAIGKGYDRFMEGTGKMVVPGEKISWDQHIHAVGEEIKGGTEIGLWFYPEGAGADQAQLPRGLHRPSSAAHRGRRLWTFRRTRLPTPKASRC